MGEREGCDFSPDYESDFKLELLKLAFCAVAALEDVAPIPLPADWSPTTIDEALSIITGAARRVRPASGSREGAISSTLALHLLGLIERQLTPAYEADAYGYARLALDVGDAAARLRLASAGVFEQASVRADELLQRQRAAELGRKANRRKGDPFREAARQIVMRERYRPTLSLSECARQVAAQFPDRDPSGIRNRIKELFEPTARGQWKPKKPLAT